MQSLFNWYYLLNLLLRCVLL